jgi:ABC-type multidrug transport system fused ATPase/permease subunit
MALVSQEALVFDGTIMDNLGYGHPAADSEGIVSAARAAHAHEFIERLPNGYNTIVGERGVLLSGGQKQRLALARAMVGRASILLLDEPTSALDAESELAVQQALAELQASKTVTVIIIAHRLSTVRHADQIIVLENGRVLGSGTHDELVKSAPWYRRVVKLQLGDSFESSLQPTASLQ